MALKLRRDTDALRLTVVLAEGEPFYTTDTKQLWIGDGETLGGNHVASLVYQTTLGSIMNGLISASVHDIPNPSNVCVLTPSRQVMEVYSEIRANGDVYIESNVNLNNHILKIS